jgi:hypothetical protein
MKFDFSDFLFGHWEQGEDPRRLGPGIHLDESQSKRAKCKNVMCVADPKPT